MSFTFQEFYTDGARIEAAFGQYFYRANASQEKDSYELLVCHGNVIRYFVCRWALVLFLDIIPATSSWTSGPWAQENCRGAGGNLQDNWASDAIILFLVYGCPTWHIILQKSRGAMALSAHATALNLVWVFVGINNSLFSLFQAFFVCCTSAGS